MLTKLLLGMLFLCTSIAGTAQQWTPISTNDIPADFNLQAISVVSADLIWVLANSSAASQHQVPADHRPFLLRTTNGGATWQAIRPVEAIGLLAFDIHAIDANTVIFTAEGSNSNTRVILKTTNGGLTWAKITPPAFSAFIIQFFDANNGVVLDNIAIAITSDGGNTWRQITAPDRPTLSFGEVHAFYSADNFSTHYGNSMWIGTTKGRVMRTLNRGLNWQVFQAAGVFDNITSIAFTDANNGVLTAAFNGSTFEGYEQSRLFTTKDAGTTWTPAAFAPMGEITNLAAVPGAPNHYFAGSAFEINGNNPIMSLNTNGLDRQSWISTLDSSYVQAIEFISPTVGYAAGFSSKVSDEVIIDGESFNRNYIWKWTGNVLSSTSDTKQELDFKVFPNPSSDWVFIERTDGDASPLFVTLTDLSGRTVLANEVTNNKLNIQDLPSGLYVLKIQTTQGTVARKIVRS